MSKITFAALVLTLAATFTGVGTSKSWAVPASSQTNGKCANRGYCKPGTCARDGGNHACNPKNCSKKYCR